MSVFVNRILNLKRIKAIGFDMDYTIVRYQTENFERLSYEETAKKLVELRGYPKELVTDFEFDFKRTIQGLIVDKLRGNLLKVNRFGRVKIAFHGMRQLEFRELKKIYNGVIINLNDPNIQSLDTNFSVSNGVLFLHCVELKNRGFDMPTYEEMADEIKEVIDICHSDGTLKDAVRDNIDQYIIQDPNVAPLLEKFKAHGKKLLVITNSDYNYTKLLLSHCINPFLTEHKDWSELFEITITLSSKPKFFYQQDRFLAIDPDTGLMSNNEGPVVPGIYQAGNAAKLQQDLGLEGDEILYLGDHIYGDVVSLKKTFNWRTALVLDPLEEEIEATKASRPTQDFIDEHMALKEDLEYKLNQTKNKEEVNDIYSEIEKINSAISEKIEEYRQFFNPYWGEMMRAGLEESRFADQVEKYACIYVTKIEDLLQCSPRTYFRPRKRILPHEVTTSEERHQ